MKKKKEKRKNRPSGDLDDNVIEAGLEAGDGNLGNRVLDVGQGDAESKLGSNEGLEERLKSAMSIR
jgi:hypothetical protein